MGVTPKRESEYWKVLAMAVVAAVIPFVTYWAAFARSAVNGTTVEQMIQRDSPYVADRSVIQYKLDQNTAAVTLLAAEVDKLRLQQAQLTAQLRGGH